MAWLWTICFGVAGVSLRFGIDSWLTKIGSSFPIGTLLINITGCFIAGVLFGSGLQKNLPGNPIRLGMIVGFCGGFTTFSGFGLQFMQLVNSGKMGAAFTYGVGTPALCVLATAGGLLTSRIFS